METKFRPGPWNISRYKEGRRLLIIDSEGFDVAAVDYPNRDETAALIAAAPDLYAVLSELEESCEYWSEYDVPLGMVDRIKSALKRARGEQ